MYVINAVLKTNPEKIYGMSCEAISYLCASDFTFKNFSKLANLSRNDMELLKTDFGYD